MHSDKSPSRWKCGAINVSTQVATRCSTLVRFSFNFIIEFPYTKKTCLFISRWKARTIIVLSAHHRLLEASVCGPMCWKLWCNVLIRFCQITEIINIRLIKTDFAVPISISFDPRSTRAHDEPLSRDAKSNVAIRTRLALLTAATLAMDKVWRCRQVLQSR